MSNLKPIIGLEIHAQLNTSSKLFCGCRVSFGEEPNTNVCEVCLGLPGVLPVLNREAVNLALKMALSLDCEINNHSRFARKNYFYPDLPKGYQISQYKIPIAVNGKIEVDGHIINIRRLHLEEESAKLIHSGSKTLVDYNRAGVPLIEIVTEPDITSPEMAIKYLKKIQKILRFTEVSDAVMAEAKFRCEPNISLKRNNKPGTRTEIKNLNSFKAVKNALEYEIERHRSIIESDREVKQQTMLYSESTGKTRAMRSKEGKADYRYFPEPDLPPLEVSVEQIQKTRESLPDLPEKRKKRYVKWGINDYEANLIAGSVSASELFEKTVKILDEPEEISKWIIREYFSFNEPQIRPEYLARLVKMIIEGKISINAGQTVFEEMVNTDRPPEKIVEEKDLVQISDKSSLQKKINDIFEKFPEEKRRYLNGEEKLKGFFIGQVMKETGGKADPKEVSKLLSKYEKNNTD